MARWAGERTWREPIIFILHVGYAFVPLGALALGIAILWPALIASTGALHAWTTGAIGTMTLAVMTRATLGHTGQALQASIGTQCLYAAIIAAALTRVCASIDAAHMHILLMAAAICWTTAFLGFVLLYGPTLCSPRKA